MRVEVARNGTPGVCVEGVQSDPASRGVGEFTGGKEGGELRKFGIEAVHFTFNTKGLGGREEKRRMLLSSGGPTGSGGGRCRRFGNCHSFSTDSMRDFRYSRAFMGSFSRKGDATRKPKSRMTSGVVIERIFSLEKPGME